MACLSPGILWLDSDLRGASCARPSGGQRRIWGTRLRGPRTPCRGRRFPLPPATRADRSSPPSLLLVDARDKFGVRQTSGLKALNRTQTGGASQNSDVWRQRMGVFVAISSSLARPERSYESGPSCGDRRTMP